ncbi:MAG: DUF4097 family beta strand repeat protein [Lachnospiraceae bacterium]|nr:DUF4097 family beta strand repeat protein [Lachnospiraceae bacterium]
MNRKEYMEKLSKALEGIEASTAAEIMEDYEAHFERAKEDGRTEEEVIAELGSIEEFVQELGQFVQKEEKVIEEHSHEAAQEETIEEHSSEAAPEEAVQKEASQEKYSGAYRWNDNSEAAWNEADAGQTHTEQSQQDTTQGKKWSYGSDTQKYAKKAGEFTEKTVKVVNDVVGQLSIQFDKAFSKFSDWFNSYEKSGESEEAYQKRQENAKVQHTTERTVYEHTTADEVSRQEMENREYESYVSDCTGVLREAEGIKNVSIDAKQADVYIYPSTDNQFHYAYQNHGSAGSKIVYRLDQRRTSDTLFLTVAKNEEVQRKNHFSILGGVFDSTSSLELKLYVPEWMRSITCDGKSGDIKAENVDVRVLQLKTLSGDVELLGGESLHTNVESTSGDVVVRRTSAEQLLAASKSGDVRGEYIQAQKTVFRSMSGDVAVEFIDAREISATSMSGDADAENCKSDTLEVCSTSGDASAKRIDSRNLKAASTSGDVMVTECQTQNSIVTSVSGDVDVPKLFTERLSASTTSGEISLRGAFNEMEVSTASGDIVVVQNGDTRARIHSRSGEVNFHLKNKNRGFLANLQTHGDVNFRYNDLVQNDAGKGEHRCGAEGSLLDFSLISGDIVIAD